jgi:enoyl-CoA hydratase/carnithine racemase
MDIIPSTTAGLRKGWHRSWTHLRVDRRSLGYCRVTFDHPPINAITATTVAEFAELVGLIEEDHDLNVVVFDSANPDFYLSEYDAEDDPGRPAAVPRGRSGIDAWLDLLVRLSRVPVVSIASIRGRARGAGSEFVLACDLRFASRENTLLGPVEVGARVVPGGRAMARLSRLVGRRRALEILVVADDLDTPRAERYGYVNRVIADDQARRPGRADRVPARTLRRRGTRAHEVVRRRVMLPADNEAAPALADFVELLGRGQQEQSAALEAAAPNSDSDLEPSLGPRVAESSLTPEIRPDSTRTPSRAVRSPAPGGSGSPTS